MLYVRVVSYFATSISWSLKLLDLVLKVRPSSNTVSEDCFWFYSVSALGAVCGGGCIPDTSLKFTSIRLRLSVELYPVTLYENEEGHVTWCCVLSLET